MTAAKLWLTNSTVRPLPATSDMRSRHLRLELGVADRQHLVDHQDLGLEVRRDGEGEPDVHADRVALDRRVDELARRPRTRRSRRSVRRISARLMPRMAPFRKMFSRPVSSGWKPVPTSSRLATRPLIVDPALGRLGDARQDLEQGRLARAVVADDADHLAALDLEIDVAQRPELLDRRRRRDGAAAEHVDGLAPEQCAAPRVITSRSSRVVLDADDR